MAGSVFNTRDFLSELGIQGDDLALIETKLTPHADKLQGMVLRQSDYSQKMDALQQTQADLQAANERLSAEAAEWATLTAAEKAAAGNQRRSLEAAENKVAQLSNRLKTIAAQAGVTEEAAFEGLDKAPVQNPPPAAQPPAVDATRLDQLAQNQGAIANMGVILPALYAKIGREHRALTGEDVDEVKIAQEIQKRAATRGNQKSLDPVDVWEELYGIPDKRQAKAAADHQAEIAAAVERGRVEGLSQAAVPTGSRQAQHSVVLTQAGGRQSVLNRPQPGSSIASAVSAFQSGKYRTERPGAPAKTA